MSKGGRSAKKIVKIVAFDLDETIGAFPALSGLMMTIQPHMFSFPLLQHVLRSNPNYIRPHMMQILAQLNEAKKVHPMHVVLYTNNPNRMWVLMILNYINIELNLTQPLFDFVLDASAHLAVQSKSVEDLLQRTQLYDPFKKHTKTTFRIFFVDDLQHVDMRSKSLSEHDNAEVDYYHIKAYAQPNPDDVEPSRELYRRLRNFVNS
jgi:hypothetical protein